MSHDAQEPDGRRRLAGAPLHGFAVATGVVLAWQAAVSVFAIPAYILPGPRQVFASAWEDGLYLAYHAGITVSEILLGLLIGAGLGCVTALAMALVPSARRLVMPMIVFTQALPVFAIAPLLVIWFGYGLASKIVMATLIIYFPVASAFHDGLSRTDEGLVDLARIARATPMQTLSLIRIPAALPSLGTGLRVAASVAPIGAVVGEWVGSAAGLGFVMLQANARMQTDLMFAALIILGIAAIAIRYAVDAVLRRVLFWAPET